MTDGKNPKLPDVRVACFCDQVIQGADNAMSIVRIVDRINADLLEPLPPPTGPDDRIPYQVTLFVVLDGVRAWSGSAVEVWTRSPRKPFEKKADIQLGAEGRASDTANIVLPTAIDLRHPGVFEVEFRLKGRRLARRRIELVVTLPSDRGAPAE